MTKPLPLLAFVLSLAAPTPCLAQAAGAPPAPECYSSVVPIDTLCEAGVERSIYDARALDGCHRIRREVEGTACIHYRDATRASVSGISYRERDASGKIESYRHVVFGIDRKARDLSSVPPNADPANPVRGDKTAIWIPGDVVLGFNLFGRSRPAPEPGQYASLESRSYFLDNVSKVTGLKSQECYRNAKERAEACLIFFDSNFRPGAVTYSGPETGSQFLWISQEQARAHGYDITASGLFASAASADADRTEDFQSSFRILRERVVKPIVASQAKDGQNAESVKRLSEKMSTALGTTHGEKR